MHWLCFGGPKDARRAQDDSSLVTETEAVRLMSNVEPERKTRAADLLKLFQGVEYVTPDREALVRTPKSLATAQCQHNAVCVLSTQRYPRASRRSSTSMASQKTSRQA